MVRCLTFVVAATIALATLGAQAGRTAELVMFERKGCPYCDRFNREIAPIWPRTELGRRAPLRRVDIDGPIPDDLRAVPVERITPVFVVLDEGREIGRIRGYPGEDHFWGLIAGLIDGLPAPTTSGAAPGVD